MICNFFCALYTITRRNNTSIFNFSNFSGVNLDGAFQNSKLNIQISSSFLALGKTKKINEKLELLDEMYFIFGVAQTRFTMVRYLDMYFLYDITF